MSKQGSLSINSENLFPIIKKWLYSDHDIFYRELISNACDAVTKLDKLSLMGDEDVKNNRRRRVVVVVNDQKGTVKIMDDGIGMSEAEVDEYINQIAFSGATAFFEKYKDKTTEDQIIGHFGLGFYSAFMVADQVTIDTLSYRNGSEPVYWTCDGGTEYSMQSGSRKEHGTEITLYLNDESKEFSNKYRAEEVITKYCSFMPVEIFLFTEEEWEKQLEKEEEILVEEAVDTAEDAEASEEEKAPVSLSDTEPLWTKHPNECTDEDYIAFYRKVFNDYKEPLFWIHLNMDYPFNLKGILYFPKLNFEYESAEGVVKLYNNRVFIADNIKEVIPEFLLLLKGVIDCPDLPLNVSRSALQNDGFVKKISDYITKKVADKLNGLCNVERENYEKYWEDIHPFIKYGCLKDEKFFEKMKKSLLFKDLKGEWLTLKDLEELPSVMEDAPYAQPDAPQVEKIHIAYVTDAIQQSQYMKMYKDADLTAVILDSNIDQAFIGLLESKDSKLKFMRIDSEIENALKVSEDALSDDLVTKLTETFRNALGEEQLQITVENLKNEELASMITTSEENRRMQEMMKMYGMAGMGDETPETLVLNAKNKLVQYILEHAESEHAELFCKQIYDLAKISHKPMSAEELSEFVTRSNQIMLLLAQE